MRKSVPAWLGLCGARAAHLRGARSQPVMAAQLGLSVRHLRRLEGGECEPHAGTREHFAAIFGEDPWDTRGARNRSGPVRAVNRGRRLRRRREQLDLTQQQVAHISRERAVALIDQARPEMYDTRIYGLSAQIVSNFELGKTRGRSWEMPTALCLALGIEYDLYFPHLPRPEVIETVLARPR